MDPKPEVAEAAAGEYGGRVCLTFEELLTADVDAVLIASPHSVHAEQALAAAQAGKHVLVEKPMAPSPAECRAILEACRHAGVTLMVGLMKRFDPAFETARQMVEAGELGEVHTFSCDWGWPQFFLAGWRDTAAGGGGLLMDHGSHTLDLARWFLGEIESVSATVRSLLPGREVEDEAQVMCRHVGGGVSLHHHSRQTHRPLHECYHLEGTRGTLTLECRGQWSATQLHPFTLTLWRNTTGIAACGVDCSPQPTGTLDSQIRDQWRYSRLLAHFAHCVADGTPPVQATGDDGLAAATAVRAAVSASK
jgi:predicted dehydrogenase